MASPSTTSGAVVGKRAAFLLLSGNAGIDASDVADPTDADATDGVVMR